MEFKLIYLSLTTLLTTVFCEDIKSQNEVINENLNITDQTIIGNAVNITGQKIIENAVNEFGYKLLLTMMEQEKDENIIISPTSIAGLLAMILLGTVGKTLNELAGALGFSQDVIVNRKNHEQFGDLLSQLNSNGSSETLYADAVFVDGGTVLHDLFREYMGRVYHGDAVNVDFKQGVLVKDMINEWVSSHTKGKLENFLLQPLPEETKVVLLSALYFRGQWLHPFLPEYTLKMTFKKPANEVLSDQMLNMGSFDYVLSEEYGLHMIALPYNDSVTTMYALKPFNPEQQSLSDLMKRLDYATIDGLIKTMSKSKSVIRFPKMDVQSKVQLEKYLKALGLQSLFTPGEANFALMVATNPTVSNKTEVEHFLTINTEGKEKDNKGFMESVNSLPNPGIYVDTVLHDVKLTINEYGTEAVAATAGILARTAKLFYADSPFYMFIRNEKTGLVTFSAVIYDPTA